MQRADIEQLAKTRGTPAVSVLLPLQQRRPGNAEDPLRLRRLVDSATARLQAEHDRSAAAPVVERLQQEAARVDLHHPGAGLAIFATADESHLLMLPFSVRERVVINETFATRDLVLGLHRSERFRTLVLARKSTRLLEGAAGSLDEVTAHGFPVAIEPPTAADTPHRDLPIHETEEKEEAYRFVFRAVDRALGEAHAADPLPVVLVGVERDLAYFDEVTTHGAAVIGRVAGNHSHATPSALAALVQPTVDAHFAARRAESVERLVAAIGAKRAATGIDDVWQPARAGRGHLLLVEEDYSFPARVVDDHLEATEPATPRALDDAVDEIAESVLAQGGDVVVVESGALAAHGRIGLVLRY